MYNFVIKQKTRYNHNDFDICYEEEGVDGKLTVG